MAEHIYIEAMLKILSIGFGSLDRSDDIYRSLCIYCLLSVITYLLVCLMVDSQMSTLL